MYEVFYFLSAFNTPSNSDVSVLGFLLWYVNSDYFDLWFGLTLSTSSGIELTVSLSSRFYSDSDVESCLPLYL